MRSMTFRLLLFTFVSLGVFVIPAYAGSESGSPARPADSGRRADGDQAWWDGFSLNGTDPTPEGMTVYNGNLARIIRDVRSEAAETPVNARRATLARRRHTPGSMSRRAR